MIRLIVFGAGVVAGALGTRVVPNPKKVAEKLRAAANFVVKKLREAFQTDPGKGEGPVNGAQGET
jgi:hypothetical protein